MRYNGGRSPTLASCPMSDVTRILSQINDGDPKAAEQLLPLVYDELRKLAAVKMAREKPGQTLQATALVHEAYVRLVGEGEHQPSWDSRGHFFAAAAEAMRRILVDRARKKQALRRGGGSQRETLEKVADLSTADADELLDLDEALQRLEQLHPTKAKLVKLRYFAGLTIPEAAEAMQLSITTANRYWSYARAWLHEELSGHQTTKDG
jgi:RNA polymerase sigma factor (TIGR02999 family)